MVFMLKARRGRVLCGKEGSTVKEQEGDVAPGAPEPPGLQGSPCQKRGCWETPVSEPEVISHLTSTPLLPCPDQLTYILLLHSHGGSNQRG